ncbi:MAG TPA: NPCBM/NEW2 domain-containing protein [Candidatus Brocadiia bacterium]|nr:NPCBM/NEW2 domain-containing protein [Candidatus Brocadiia bacterium]
MTVAALLTMAAFSAGCADKKPGTMAEAAAIPAQPVPVIQLKREAGCVLLTNSVGGDALKASANAPLFDFGDFRIGGPDAGTGAVEKIDDRQFTVAWPISSPRRAIIRATYRTDGSVARKWATIEFQDGPPAILKSVTLDEIDAAGQEPKHRADVQSHAVICRSFFVGVEFPIATTKVEGTRVILSHAPGKLVAPGETFRTRTAVYGAAIPGSSRKAFESYIASLRPTPRGIHFNYNSWWTSPVPYTEGDILKIIGEFRRNLHDPYGVSPDSFCIDMGWAKNTTLWRIDPALFPKGFEGIQKACADIRSAPGLWISPSGVYAQALDLAWAKGAGYEADAKACLGGKRYQSAFKETLLDMVSRYGVRHVKFDGYVAVCDAKDHGHEPGALSAEAIAEGMIDVFESLRKVAPDLWMEPTCFGFDPSPWWVQYCNSVIGTFGDDAPYGRVPCPVYRESYTTARDYYNLKGARDIQAPIAAQEVLGIIHQTTDPIENDAVMCVMRGHQFISLYVNPDCMTPRRWHFLAGLMAWAKANQEILQHTTPILPESWRRAGGGPAIFEDTPAPREAYGYAHWLGNRGLICLRNPWIEPAEIRLSSENIGGPKSGAWNMKAIYPDSDSGRFVADGKDGVSIRLKPYETVVFEMRPDIAGLGQSTAPATQAIRQKTILSGITADARASRFECAESGPAYGPDYTRLLTGEGPRLRTRWNCRVPGDAIKGKLQLLVLIEGPSAVSAPVQTLKFNGKLLVAVIISSEGGWRATGAPPPEHWMWISAALPEAQGDIEGDVILSDPAQALSAWIVAVEKSADGIPEWDQGAGIPCPEINYAVSVPLFRNLTLNNQLPVEKGEAPVIRVNGVYLDTLEPASASQGWGKLERNRSVWEKPMVIGGRRFSRGLGTHSPSRIVYNLDGGYKRFQCWAGADQATGPTITMEVRVDGKSAWKSELLTRTSPPQRVDVDVSAAKTLELLVGNGGNDIMADHADWADAILTK